MTIKLRIVLILIMPFLISVCLNGEGTGKWIKIKGKVVDINQIPVRDAIIMIDNIATSSSTNSKGIYKIKVYPSAQKIGIITSSSVVMDESISGRTIIDFFLKDYIVPDTAIPVDPADEEEINIGYGTVKRKNLTQQVGRIDGTNKKYSSYPTIYDMIRGEMPGVRVEGNKITIQGTSSFIGSSDPLLVVDGVPVSSIDEIHPQMVRSIEVLKGSSASIYGTRGANGVILIYLKTGEDIK
jgi:TonB-dependent SusC/RagA subfamily outer membrane receptor